MLRSCRNSEDCLCFPVLPCGFCFACQPDQEGAPAKYGAPLFKQAENFVVSIQIMSPHDSLSKQLQRCMPVSPKVFCITNTYRKVKLICVCAGSVGQIRKSFHENEREERIPTILLGSFVIIFYIFLFEFWATALETIKSSSTLN